MSDNALADRLEACPFCGKADTLVVTDSDQWEIENDIEPSGHDTYYAVFCDGSKPNGRGGCGASSGFKPTEDDAIATWNRRTRSQQAAGVQEPTGVKLARQYLAEGRLTDMEFALLHYIDQLIAASPAPAVPQGWIACSERLPDGNDDVLTCTTEGAIQSRGARWVRALFDEAKADGEPCYFTHWMPLPASPREGGK